MRRLCRISRAAHNPGSMWIKRSVTIARAGSFTGARDQPGKPLVAPNNPPPPPQNPAERFLISPPNTACRRRRLDRQSTVSCAPIIRLSGPGSSSRGSTHIPPHMCEASPTPAGSSLCNRCGPSYRSNVGWTRGRGRCPAPSWHSTCPLPAQRRLPVGHSGLFITNRGLSRRFMSSPS